MAVRRAQRGGSGSGRSRSRRKLSRSTPRTSFSTRVQQQCFEPGSAAERAAYRHRTDWSASDMSDLARDGVVACRRCRPPVACAIWSADCGRRQGAELRSPEYWSQAERAGATGPPLSSLLRTEMAPRSVLQYPLQVPKTQMQVKWNTLSA
jgi:hypothetical protein